MKPYDQGYAAYKNDRVLSECPYSQKQDVFQWRRGFFNAREDDFDERLILEENMRHAALTLYKLFAKDAKKQERSRAGGRKPMGY